MVNNNNIESTGSKLANGVDQVWYILPALELPPPLDLSCCRSMYSQWEAIPLQAICIKDANSDRSIISVRSALLRFLQTRVMIGGILHIYQYQRQPLWDDRSWFKNTAPLSCQHQKCNDTYYPKTVGEPQKYRIANYDCWRLKVCDEPVI